MTQDNRYSLWLRPSQYQIDELTKIISTLAHRYRTTPFPPHITLLPSITLNPENIKQVCNKIIEQHYSLEITLTDIGFSEHYYRNLYILAHLDEKLSGLYQQSKKLFNIEVNETYMPHVSLIYGELSRTQQQSLQKELANSYPKKIICDRIDIYDSTEKESQWHLIKSFNLRALE